MKTQIVVVGGGAGGLELVARLGATLDRERYDRTKRHVVVAAILNENSTELIGRHHIGYDFWS